MMVETTSHDVRFNNQHNLGKYSRFDSLIISADGAKLEDALRRARAHSAFLADLIERDPTTIDLISAAEPVTIFGDADTDEPPTRYLRLARRRLALSVAIADLCGVYDLTQVTTALSDFADRAVDIAIRTAITERTPSAEPLGFVAIALGKQGSGELNYSSDIDPIFLFDPDTLPRRVREEPGDAAVRIARRVVDLLQTRDRDGYVLRVDLRLRPSPEVTPIALSVGAAISYYESLALPWERAAFIRARAASGDLALGHHFLRAIEPFVWRRSLDYGAIGEIRGITRRIRDHNAAGQVFGPGFDLKRGRGGIREIEFFTQIHQLIHGGREPGLRAPATREALARLSEAGVIDAQAARDLTDAYTLLRTIEHRVQMIDDRQTHTLPTDAALERIARLHGLPDARSLLAQLAPHVERTGATYDAIDEDRAAGLPRDPDALGRALERAGYVDPRQPIERISVWRAGTYPALRSSAAQEALEAVLPGLLAALVHAAEPNAALLRLDRLLERLPSAVNLLRLLQARPGLADLLVAILSHAPPLADELARWPALLDGLVDASAFDAVAPVEALRAAMAGDPKSDYQARLDHVRAVVGEARFALGAQLVAGASDPLEIGAGYARVAEAAIGSLAERTVAEFERAHGRVPDGELIVLALGRMGGGLLTHASDLDLIYLFTGGFDAESDGAKPLGATLYFNRLAQRVTAALSVATASGPLYPVDTRLRPSGDKGPLAVSVDSFARYQREEAWTWEHMALTRARVVHGSDAARQAVGSLITDILAGGRLGRDVRADARAMRAELRAHKPAKGPLDAKLLSGGLVDLEFAVHVVQLVERTGFEPHLGRAIAALIEQGLVSPAMADAHDFLTRLLVTVRLLAPDADEPAEDTRSVIARAMRLPDWARVVAEFERTRHEVTLFWQQAGGAA